jgi:multisubunit Na+/H+ antiporter MnhB subunit
VKPSMILDVMVRVVFHTVLVLSLYLLFAGHNQPGGGFIGGLVASAAFALRYVGGGVEGVQADLRFRPWTLLGLGLVLASFTALGSLVFGDALLESGKATLDLGPLGSPKVTSALPFDTGVYLIVVGMTLMLFEAFGESIDARRVR